MIDHFLSIVSEHPVYLLLALGICAALLLLKILLNRPSRREREHARRLHQLKETHKDRYR